MSVAGNPVLILVEHLFNEELGDIIWNHPQGQFEILHKEVFKIRNNSVISNLLNNIV